MGSWPAVKTKFTLCRTIQSKDEADQSRFPNATRANNCDMLTRGDMEQ